MTALADPADAFVPLSRYGKARLVVEILEVYARVRWSLLRSDFRTTLERSHSGTGPVTAGDRAAVVNGRRLGRAVSRTLALLPTDARCLVRALVLSELLARRGMDSSLVIGVRAEPEFGAHAWVECGGAALLPSHGYERLVELGGTGEMR